MNKILFLTTFLIGFSFNYAQTNQLDNNGKHHGIWTKSFKNGNIRYKGEFNHGKEIGVFKFYSPADPKQPTIIKTFNNNDNIAFVEFYSKTGKLLSKGKMQGKKRMEKWIYFHADEKTIMQKEFYINGKLEGEYNTFYKNSKPTIEANYKNDKLHGSYKRYSYEGRIFEDLYYKNGILNGAVTYYNRLNGNLIKKGNYTNGEKVGIWEFYFEGELSNTKNFSN